ncbi:ribokinase [Arenimonas sp.]|uniref:ribokinase n=1 Tax=Arenimonas sp. TaxID=1872635 RepID=UPI0039E4751B
MSRVVVVGSFNQDHVWRSERFPQPGETRLGLFSCGPGGKGFNQAVAAARLGGEAHFIGALGRDAIGDGAAALAASENIHGRWQRCDDEATGTAAILLDGNGQNLIVVGPGANMALSPEHVDANKDAFKGAQVLLTQQEVNPAATLRAMRLARGQAVTTVHNPAPASSEVDLPWLLIDILTPNESEFAHLLERRAELKLAAEALATQDDASLHALCRRLCLPTVIVTLGSAGVFVSAGEMHFRVAAETVQVRDTTGAGDAFNGAFAAGLAQGMALEDAVRFANRAAALKVERAGAALAMPTLAELQARFS